MNDVSAVFDWLVDGAPGAKTPVDVVARMCPELAVAGVPVERCEAFVRTLHPHIAGRSFLWLPGKSVDVHERTYAFLHSEAFAASATAEVFRSGLPLRAKLDHASAFPDLEVLRSEGYTDLWAGPLSFIGGHVHAISFATRRAGGFTDEHVAALAHVLRPLSRVAEIFALLRTATNLLNAYVGHDAGERILKGQIQRGDTNVMRAAIWFSDLRGFTSLSSTLQPKDVIAMLNDLFDCQVPAIESHGGEVLKFMGDGLLAIFPVHELALQKRRCADALAAVDDAYRALDALNGARGARGMVPVRFGVALHIGEIAYGNIGGSTRLDFTCIGAAVNLASRLEGLTGKLGENVVISEEFSTTSGLPSAALGHFELKGVPGSVAAFKPLTTS